MCYIESEGSITLRKSCQRRCDIVASTLALHSLSVMHHRSDQSMHKIQGMHSMHQGNSFIVNIEITH